MASLEFLKGVTRWLREEWVGGNLKGYYLKLIPGLCLEDRMKMAAGDMVSIRGQVMEYTYIPTGIKWELMRSDVDYNWKG